MSSDSGASTAVSAGTVYGFADNAAIARALAAELGLAFVLIEVHAFPDGECRVRAVAATPHAILLRSLHHPNNKLVELVLAASALRDTGARTLTLVAPYLAYMRQDKAFHPGEAVSQKVIGRLLAERFDRFVSVDPHLHRTPSLSNVFLGKPALALTAAPAICAHIAQRALPSETVLIGPDEESRPWVSAVAEPLGLSWVTALKHRQGDRDVTITLPTDFDFNGRPVIVVDDVISSGGTLRVLAELLRAGGAVSIEAYTTHALLSADDEGALRSAGIRGIYSCDSVPHRTNAIDLVPTLAHGLRQWR